MKQLDYLSQKWGSWPYKNTTLLIVSLILFFYLADTSFIQTVIRKFSDFGYLSAFFIGVLFVSIFTVAPAIVILYNMADILNPFVVAILAGAGAVLGDYLIFYFLKERVFKELAPIFDKMGGSFVKKLFFTPYFIWLLPLIGALIIASPLPDEFGVGILGLSKVKNWQFILISFLLNATGIFIIVTIARSF